MSAVQAQGQAQQYPAAAAGQTYQPQPQQQVQQQQQQQPSRGGMVGQMVGTMGGGLTSIMQKGISYMGGWQPIPYQSTAVITGASSGIGLQFAKVLAENGIHLVLVSDIRDELLRAREEVSSVNSSVKVIPVARDLSTPTAARELYQELRNQNVDVDILINNAAFTNFGKFVEGDLDRQLRIIQLSTISLVMLCWLFGNDMRKRGGGKILNVSSITAFAPGPNQAVYAACTSFILNFSEAIAYEMKNTGVSVTCLLPGATRETQFPMRAGITAAQPLPRAFRGWAPMLDARTVAKRGYRGLLAGRRRIIPGWLDWMIYNLSIFMPKELLMRIAYFLNAF